MFRNLSAAKRHRHCWYGKETEQCPSRGIKVNLVPMMLVATTFTRSLTVIRIPTRTTTHCNYLTILHLPTQPCANNTLSTALPFSPCMIWMVSLPFRYVQNCELASSVTDLVKVPGRRCPACLERGQTVWVIPGKCCPTCGTPVN